jgi:hypothetical protein
MIYSECLPTRLTPWLRGRVSPRSASPDTWALATGDALDIPRGDACAVAIGEKGYVFGGWSHTNGWCPALAAVEAFDPISHTVRAVPGRLSALGVPYRFPMKIYFVRGFCMGAQGA